MSRPKTANAPLLPTDDAVAVGPTASAAPLEAPPTAMVPTAPTVLPPTPTVDAVPMLERLAKDPAVDVEKLERLIGMQERAQERDARALFWAAFPAMQGELPEIDEHGRIMVDGTVRSGYAKNEDIQAAVRPILKRHGFALTFRERRMDDGKLDIVGLLAHSGGHVEEDHFVTTPDDGGKMNTIQRRGSARSYGQRYVTIFLLNIVTREKQRGADDDGQGSEAPDTPNGVTALLAALEKGIGTPTFFKSWNQAAPEDRQFITKHLKQQWDDLKATHAAKAAAR